MFRRLVLVLALLASVVAAGAPANGEPAPAGDAVVVMTGLEPLVAQLPDLLAEALDEVELFAAEHPDDLAHPWVDRDAGEVVIPVVTEDGAALVAGNPSALYPDVPRRVENVVRSYSQLEDIMHASIDLTDHDAPGGSAIYASYVDAGHNRVIVETGAAPASLVALLAALFGDAVAVRVVPGADGGLPSGRNNDVSPFSGGASINVCTSGFSWRPSTTTFAMVTAGHCKPTGGSVSTPSATMGSVTSQYGESWVDGTGSAFIKNPDGTLQAVYHGDVARISVSPGSTQARVYTGAAGSTSTKLVTSIWSRRGKEGDQYCTGGMTAGELCGWSVDWTKGDWKYSNGEVARHVSAGRKDGRCIQAGDSGGPVYTATSTTVTAKGIISGATGYGGDDHNVIWPEPACRNVYTDIWDYREGLGGSLQIPAETWGAGALTINQTIPSGGVLWSRDQRIALRMQSDGNLVIYAPGNRAVWATGTNNSANVGSYARMQDDGNFVIYRPNGQPVWATGTNNRPGAVVVMQNDCNLVVYAPGPFPVWSSNTTSCG